MRANGRGFATSASRYGWTYREAKIGRSHVLIFLLLCSSCDSSLATSRTQLSLTLPGALNDTLSSATRVDLPNPSPLPSTTTTPANCQDPRRAWPRICIPTQRHTRPSKQRAMYTGTTSWTTSPTRPLAPRSSIPSSPPSLCNMSTPSSSRTASRTAPGSGWTAWEEKTRKSCSSVSSICSHSAWYVVQSTQYIGENAETVFRPTWLAPKN